jgi:hypothetical protein
MTNWWVYQHLSLNIPGHTWCWKKDNASTDQYTWCNRNHTHIISDNLRIYDYIYVYDICIIRHKIHNIYLYSTGWFSFYTGGGVQLDRSPIAINLRSSFEHEPSRDDFLPMNSWKYTGVQVGICLPLESWPPKKKFLKKILPEKRPDDLWPNNVPIYNIYIFITIAYFGVHFFFGFRIKDLVHWSRDGRGIRVVAAVAGPWKSGVDAGMQGTIWGFPIIQLRPF